MTIGADQEISCMDGDHKFKRTNNFNFKKEDLG